MIKWHTGLFGDCTSVHTHLTHHILCRLYKCAHTLYILETGLMINILNHICFRCEIMIKWHTGLFGDCTSVHKHLTHHILCRLSKCTHTLYILETGLMMNILNYICFRCNIMIKWHTGFLETVQVYTHTAHTSNWFH